MALFPLFKKRYEPKSYYPDEPKVPWYVVHRPLVFIGVGIALMAIVAVVITIYISKNTPVAKLSYAFTKDLDAGCDFYVQAAVNDENQMVFEGSSKITGQEVYLVYDADYNDYTYQGVTLTQEGMNYSGSCYQDKWNVKVVNSKVQDFMDFYSDLRYGFFDTGSLLRYLGITEKYSSVEFGSLLGKVFPRFATENKITHMKLIETDESTTYAYDLDMDEFLTLLEKMSASAFFKSSDYDKFAEKIELNHDTLRRANVQFSFRISKKGYLENIYMMLESDEQRYTLNADFDQFGEPTHIIPDSFYPAADIKNPNLPETVAVTQIETEAPTAAPTAAPQTEAPTEEEGEQNGEEEENEETDEEEE